MSDIKKEIAEAIRRECGGSGGVTADNLLNIADAIDPPREHFEWQGDGVYLTRAGREEPVKRREHHRFPLVRAFENPGDHSLTWTMNGRYYLAEEIRSAQDLIRYLRPLDEQGEESET